MNATSISLVTTIIEYATLSGWVMVAGPPILALLILAGGLIVEHLATLILQAPYRAYLRGISPVLARATLLGLIEAGVWALWLVLTDTQPVLAPVVLFAGLLVGHIVEFNLVRGLPVLSLANVSRLLDFTVLETVAGVVWLAASVLVGDVVLFVGLFLEHFIALRRRAA
jgi:hypothetical protein